MVRAGNSSYHRTMDVRDLEVIVALAEHRHFARAAEACNISQPALSARIRKLEADLGVPIVSRGNRFQGFTEDGEIALKWARRLLADRDGLLQDIHQSRQRLAGTLTIGVIPTALPTVSRLTVPFGLAHPDVAITILSRSSIEIQRGLDTFALDAGITYLRNEPLSHVRAKALYRERFVLVGAPALVGRDRQAIGWGEAAALPLCLLTPDMQNRRIIDGLFGQAGRAPNCHVFTNSFVAIVGHLRSGEYASVLPVSQARVVDMDGLVALALVEPETSYEIGLVIADRDPVLPVVQRFWDEARGEPEAG